MSVRYDFGGIDGTPGTMQDVDALGPPNIRFKLADNATIDTNAKLVVPGMGLGPYYSFWKHIYLYCDDPDGNTINNIKTYSDGVNNLGAGVDWKIGLEFPINSSTSRAGYEVATGGATSGDEVVANHGGIATVASIFDYTAGVGALPVTISEAGNVINAVGERTRYTVHQWSITDAAAPGATVAETITWTYDEA